MENTYQTEKTHYLLIDSKQRPTEEIYHYGELISLPPNALQFTHGSPEITIELPGHQFRTNDQITLTNVISKNLLLHNVLSIKKNSSYIRITDHNHGLSLKGLYDKTDPGQFTAVNNAGPLPASYEELDDIPDETTYYILKQNEKMDFSIQLSNIKHRLGSLSPNYLNTKHTVYLLFTKEQSGFEPDANHYLIHSDTKSTINHPRVSASVVCIKYCNLFGIPLDLLKKNYLTISSVTTNTFSIDVNFKAIVDGPSGRGGHQSYVRKVLYVESAYAHPNLYTLKLDRIYQNVSKVRITSSAFPNSQRMVSDHPNPNNRLYWRNLEDGEQIKCLEISPGNYTIDRLGTEIERAFEKRSEFVSVKISEETDVVSLSVFKEFTFGANVHNFKIPIVSMEMTLCQSVGPDLYIYLTPNSHSYIPEKFPYAYHQLYKLDHHLTQNTFVANLELDLCILTNFYRTKGINQQLISKQELHSINSNVLLLNFSFNYVNLEVHLPNHKLKVGDFLITDQFMDNQISNKIFVYEITSIISPHNFIVKKDCLKNHFIYDSICINFGADCEWLEDLHFTSIKPMPYAEHLIITHPNHQLEIASNIIIYNALGTNHVPSTAINGCHPIERILDEDHYLIKLRPHSFDPRPLVMQPNLVSVRYPTKFQLLFNYPDTLGHLLNFRRVGEESAITSFRHRICNTDCYMLDAPDDVNPPTKKLATSTHNFFYITSPELGMFHNTKPVANVFAIIKWYGGPGTMVFDSFVPSTKVFERPTTLTEIHFAMYHPDGRLVEFNGLDHFFVLEVVERVKEFSPNELNF